METFSHIDVLEALLDDISDHPSETIPMSARRYGIDISDMYKIVRGRKRVPKRLAQRLGFEPTVVYVPRVPRD